MGNINKVIPWPFTSWENANLSEQKLDVCIYLFIFHIEDSQYVKIFHFPSRRRKENIDISETWVELGFVVMQTCRRIYGQPAVSRSVRSSAHHREWPCTGLLDWLSTTNCKELTLGRLAEPCNCCCACSATPAASPMVSLAISQRKQADNSCSGRKLSSLTPASSLQEGDYLHVCSSLPASPSCNPPAGAEGTVFRVLQKWDCF